MSLGCGLSQVRLDKDPEKEGDETYARRTVQVAGKNRRTKDQKTKDHRRRLKDGTRGETSKDEMNQ